MFTPVEPLPSDRPPRRHFWGRWFVGLLLLGVIGFAVFIWWKTDPLAIDPPVVTNQPIDLAGTIAISRCAECHADQCDAFHETPHYQTLHRADEPAMLEKFAGVRTGSDSTVIPFEFDNTDAGLVLSSPLSENVALLDYVLGSGRHGLTPVSLCEDEQGRTAIVESHVSWFRNAGYTLSPGHPKPNRRQIEHPGVKWDHKTTVQCFACHTSYLSTVDGKIDFENMVPGVRCSRCHEGLLTHLAEMEGDEKIPHEQLTVERWSEMTPQQSIERCGRCHRTIRDLKSANPMTDLTLPKQARFPPVGLEMSRCFQEQSTLRMDCLTCHDPHRPTLNTIDHYRDQCLRCHGESADTHCLVGNAASDCIACHMPPQTDGDNLAVFTDHWIRVHPE